MKKILVINAGSSSLKFQLLDATSLNLILKGICERIGIDGGIFKINFNNEQVNIKVNFKDTYSALEYLTKYMIEHNFIQDTHEIIGIGHRFVHGGNQLKESCIINKQIINILKECVELAPLHLPPEILAVEETTKLFPNAKQVAVFDTSFHRTIPPINYLYATKKEWIDKYHVRKYGFHGISYHFVTQKMQQILKKPNINLIICHLGSGCSLCAVKNAKSINTSMGFSPLDGLVMSTRTGDISPSIIGYMAKKLNCSYDEILDMCNKQSGLKGLTSYSDMRDVIDNLSNPEIQLGFNIFIKRIVNYIAMSLNDLDNQVDAIVFCGGIGEHNGLVRQKIIEGLKVISLSIDKNKNNQIVHEYLKISDASSDSDIYIVNTNEELMIAMEVQKLIA